MFRIKNYPSSVDILTELSESGRGMGVGIDPDPTFPLFIAKIPPPALFFIAFPNPGFCLPIYINLKSLIAAKAYKCKMQIGPSDWHFELYLSMNKGRKKSGRNEEGERRVYYSFLPPTTLSPFSFFLLTSLCTSPTIWTPEAGYSGVRGLVCGRKKQNTKTMVVWFKGAELRAIYTALNWRKYTRK